MKLLSPHRGLQAIALLPMWAALATAQPAQQLPNKDLLTPPDQVTAQATEITSRELETWSTDTETRGVFTGNVVVTGTNLKLTCDRLEIIATRIGDKTETIGTLEKFKYLLATGKVHIVQGEREASCGRAEVFPREDRLVLTEKPMVVDHGSEATYVGDELMLYRGQRRVTGKGVQITLPPIKDLGFDKKEAPPTAEAPKPETPATNGTNTAAPTPTPTPTPPAPSPNSSQPKSPEK
ncbi:MAG TPA: LptA/OstA family protein [Opitutaceae bacterium]|nr:LptA/OstA family protein [Opitutaceae bacterium]